MRGVQKSNSKPIRDSFYTSLADVALHELWFNKDGPPRLQNNLFPALDFSHMWLSDVTCCIIGQALRHYAPKRVLELTRGLLGTGSSPHCQKFVPMAARKQPGAVSKQPIVACCFLQWPGSSQKLPGSSWKQSIMTEPIITQTIVAWKKPSVARRVLRSGRQYVGSLTQAVSTHTTNIASTKTARWEELRKPRRS